MKAILVALSIGWTMTAAARAQTTLRGTVKETLDAGDYTYVLIATKDGDRWAAIVKTPLSKGADVAVNPETVMENFQSGILGRKFDRVAFGSLEGHEATVSQSGAASQTMPEETSKPVEKAQGPEGRTIAEVFAQKAKLKGKPVLVRGRVVKYNPKIMGSNWLHLRDGSGSARSKDNDITVTTEDAASVGDVVSVRGMVALERNLGSGYRYPVLLEKARIVK